MTRRWLLLLIGICVSIAPARCDELPAANAVPEEHPDRAVIETVLKDILSNRKSPLARGMRNKRLLFAAAKPTRDLRPDTVLDSNYEKAWKKLPQEQLADAQKAVMHLVEQAAGKATFAEFAAADPRILFLTGAQARETVIEQVFRVYPPGYAADQQLAVVYLWFPWGMHSGVATYMLVRRDNRWVIRIRQIIYYP